VSSQIAGSSSKGDHKKQILKTMTSSPDRHLRDEHIDLKVLVECKKNDLFPKAKFVFGKDEWDVGGMIHKDCIECCCGRSTWRRFG
jgi:hypothetical protein